MENILESLLKEKKEKELIKVNAIEIVNSLFGELQERERDILSRRFALKEENHQTLEEIGQLHNLTRERVRQIERASLNKLKKIDDFEKNLNDLRLVVEELMGEHGGIMEKNFLLDILAVLSYQGQVSDNSFNKDIYKNYLDFILSELLDGHIEKIDKSDSFSSFFKIKDQALGYLDEIVEELKIKLKATKDVLLFEELVEVLKNLKSFANNKTKIIKENSNLDLKKIFKDEIFPEWADIINKNKALYSLMQAVKDVNPNKFGYWGKNEHPEIKLKKISDKIFLILKEEKKPLHFTEITKKINDVKFDHKKVSSGSVHNELILDDRYILVNRGMYGLKEWQK